MPSTSGRRGQHPPSRPGAEQRPILHRRQRRFITSHADIYDDFVREIRRADGGVRVGDPTDPVWARWPPSRAATKVAKQVERMLPRRGTRRSSTASASRPAEAGSADRDRRHISKDMAPTEEVFGRSPRCSRGRHIIEAVEIANAPHLRAGIQRLDPRPETEQALHPTTSWRARFYQPSMTVSYRYRSAGRAHGRELSAHGTGFCNIKTVRITGVPPGEQTQNRPIRHEIGRFRQAGRCRGCAGPRRQVSSSCGRVVDVVSAAGRPAALLMVPITAHSIGQYCRGDPWTGSNGAGRHGASPPSSMSAAPAGMSCSLCSNTVQLASSAATWRAGEALSHVASLVVTVRQLCAGKDCAFHTDLVPERSSP